MPTNRRSLILGATLGAIAPNLVRAQSMIDIPGDPLTKLGMHAASQWATNEFREFPGCRLVFESGYAHRWMMYHDMFRRDKVTKNIIDKAVAIETCVTDSMGRRFVHSIAVDAVAVDNVSKERFNKMRGQYDWVT